MSKEMMKRTENGAQVQTSYDPFQEMRELRNAISGLFDDVLVGTPMRTHLMDLEGGRAWRAPAVDIEETEKEYVFSAELPGLEKDQFKVEVQDGILTVRGERRSHKEEKGRNTVRQEMAYGAFSRSFSLPQDARAEGISAAYKNGILRITVPRAERPKPKNVEVRVE